MLCYPQVELVFKSPVFMAHLTLQFLNTVIDIPLSFIGNHCKDSVVLTDEVYWMEKQLVKY